MKEFFAFKDHEDLFLTLIAGFFLWGIIGLLGNMGHKILAFISLIIAGGLGAYLVLERKTYPKKEGEDVVEGLPERIQKEEPEAALEKLIRVASDIGSYEGLIAEIRKRHREDQLIKTVHTVTEKARAGKLSAQEIAAFRRALIDLQRTEGEATRLGLEEEVKELELEAQKAELEAQKAGHELKKVEFEEAKALKKQSQSAQTKGLSPAERMRQSVKGKAEHLKAKASSMIENQQFKKEALEELKRAKEEEKISEEEYQELYEMITNMFDDLIAGLMEGGGN